MDSGKWIMNNKRVAKLAILAGFFLVTCHFPRTSQALRREREAHYEVEDHHDFRVAEVVVYEPARDEADETAQSA